MQPSPRRQERGDTIDNIGRGQILLADRAYASDAPRKAIDERGAWARIEPMPNRNRRPVFSHFLYRSRNLAQRFFNKLERFGAVAACFEKHPETHLALVKLAAVRIRLRVDESVP